MKEPLTTIMIMIIVLFALGSIFDMSVRVFSYGSNKVEAVESARIGMEKMEREIRAAYPVDASDPDTNLFFSADGSDGLLVDPPQAMPLPNQTTFGNERGAEGAGNGQIECPDEDSCEYITYKLSAPSNDAPCTIDPCSRLLRVNTANSGDPGDPLVENVAPGGLTFTYYEIDGSTADSEDEIIKVLVSLTVTVDPGTNYEATQELTTEVDLRNRL